MKFIGIIPARYGSTRFPGKPLADLGGRPVIQRVYEQAKKVLDTVIVATDDARIYDCVRGFGGEVLMTSPDHSCGTDRVYEAYTIYRSGKKDGIEDSDVVVVNIQGDEPFIQPHQVEALMACFPTDIATLVHPFAADDSWETLQNPNYVKVAIAREKSEKLPVMGGALYFSRSVIPHLRGVKRADWSKHGQHYRHIGMYAYRADVLARITQMPAGVLEQDECLEQLRWLENGIRIRVAVTEYASIGIDTPEDLQAAKALLEKQ